jgi:hypothetical protein
MSNPEEVVSVVSSANDSCPLSRIASPKALKILVIRAIGFTDQTPEELQIQLVDNRQPIRQ